MNTARTARRLSRRSLLAVGAGLGAGLLAGCQQQAESPGTNNIARTEDDATSANAPVITGRNLSPGRYRAVDIVIVRPEGAPTGPLPVALALHGGLGGAKSFLDLGLPDAMNTLFRQGAKPFVVVAVEGGNWVGSKDDDPHRMLAEDLPGWLTYNDLPPTPFAVLGYGEGGAAAIIEARSSSYQAVAAISPTLFADWEEASKSRMFKDRAQWESSEPLRHTVEVANMPVGVWCGTDDRPYIDLSRQLATRLNAKQATFAPGGHDDRYFKRAIPEALNFVSGYL
ncbi:alpha/beta hydrolase [Actinokineospora enzanensis]|uniref:alpha/beta hydrolase n=1 Tax=Actinokineospora enzanensis TaxID=155975 RepID=UPI000373CBE8|nr:hypothetical protein [Actinokineospora enzanensis]